VVVTKIIPSYLYQQFSDDDDLQAFVDAYNTLAQRYLDFFISLGLPIYTDLSGPLLDWVALGLYGIARPVLPFGTSQGIGPFNTYGFNEYTFDTYKLQDEFFTGGIGEFIIGVTPIGGYRTGGSQTDFNTTDDTFKRVIAWHFYKGDGKVFNIRWLKRRVMRFLNGVNGIPFNVDQTYRISVTFGVGNQVNIRIINGTSTLIGSTTFNNFAFNDAAFDTIKSTFVPLPPFAAAPILQAAIDAGVLELPFQFTWVVTV
jgi:hypothetical protein